MDEDERHEEFDWPVFCEACGREVAARECCPACGDDVEDDAA